MPTRPPTMSLAPGGGKPDPITRKVKQFYDSAAWKRFRDAVLAKQPLCCRCPVDRPKIATHLHHKQEVRQRWDLRLVEDNVEGMCNACHTAHHKRKRPR